MELVLGFKFSHHIINVFHALHSASHGFSREVGVTTRTTPVREQLWRERNVNVVIFRNTDEQVAGNPQLVSDFYACNWTHLVFPLTGHSLSVCSGDLNSSKQASFVVHVRDGASKTHVSSNRTIIRTLSTGVTIVRPAKRLLRKFSWLREEGVFLLNAVPGSFSNNLRVVPDFFRRVSEVCVCGN